MSEVSALDQVRALYDYHWWANRRLFDHTASLGEDAVGRDVGTQFSFPTVRRMLAHVYGADTIWLARWKGRPTTSIPGADIQSLAELRRRWDETEREQRDFVGALTPAALARVVEYKNTEGRQFRLALGPLLQHVANHATHHRSEAATMITMIAGSPPDTGIVTHLLMTTGQA